MSSQEPLTAVLGELGAANSQGFAGVSIIPTRQITITDANGGVIYDKRTTDTAKAADGHISMVKYRRVGDWVSGVATVEPIPASVTNKKRLKILAAAVLVASVCALIAIVNSLDADSGTAKNSKPLTAPIQKYVTVTGSVRLPANTNKGVYQIVNDPETKKATRCYPMETSSFRDLKSGGTAKIISSRGDVVEGEIEVGDWDGTYCSMRISFNNVPDGSDSYSLFLGHRGEYKVTDISVPLALSVGD